MRWSNIKNGNVSLTITGAGLPTGILKNPPPSTQRILQETARCYPSEYPIITEIVNNYKYEKLDLNKLWSEIHSVAQDLSGAYPKFYNHYVNSNTKMKLFFLKQSECGNTPTNIIWSGLGLELKKCGPITQTKVIPDFVMHY
jgi:hypothetical protein